MEARRGWTPALLCLAGVVVCSGAFLLILQSHFTFFFDDWEFLLHRRGTSAGPGGLRRGAAGRPAPGGPGRGADAAGAAGRRQLGHAPGAAGLLEDAGIPVVDEAVDGAHGVEQAVTLRPDVVLMDWRMPHLDGLAATARIRQQLPEVQVVMFSSAEGVGGGILARQAGASAFVAKGSPPEQLCAAVLAAWQPPGPA